MMPSRCDVEYPHGPQCELEAGHGAGTPLDDLERRHKSGSLGWWEPVLFQSKDDPPLTSTATYGTVGV